MDRPDKMKLFIKNSPDFFKEFNQLSYAYLEKYINILPNFLKGFQEAYDKAQCVRYGEYASSDKTRVFLTAIKTVLQTSQQIRVQEIPDFNIFNILGIARREVVATAMWKDLLDPKGSHEQGNLFLHHFLELLDNKLKSMGEDFYPYARLPMNLWVTSAEEFVRKVQTKDKDGRVDVYLKHVNSYSAVAIEYKIDADDQERQVSRYYDHLKNQKFNQSHVVYITPTGVKPSKFSLGNMDEKKVICMSIRYELVPILKQILESNNKMPIALRYFIKNYVEVAAL